VNWRQIAKGRFAGNVTGGLSSTSVFEVQDWGLQIKDLFSAIIVNGRSSTGVSVKLHVDGGPTDNINTLLIGTDVRSTVVVAGQLPAHFPCTTQSNWAWPYFRFTLTVSSATADEYVDLEIYAGGKPY
jgi:hypothetical protein